MHHFLYPKMQTCSKTEKYIQRNASTDNLPELAFLILGTYFTAPFLPCNLEKQARNVYTNFARWKWKKEKGDKS